MAIPRTVSLDGSFRSPTVLAQLDLLAVLADAMAPFLPDLSDLVDDWHFVVDEAAHVLATQSPHIQNLSDALAIWDLVLKTLVISRFPSDAKALMDAMTARLYTAVLSPDAGIACLEAAHLRAVTWVQTVGQQRNISVLKQATPIPILVGYDPDGLQFCASSSQLGNQIGWSLQLKRRALYGALIADMFLAHEYLSHMLPRNTHLSWNALLQTSRTKRFALESRPRTEPLGRHRFPHHRVWRGRLGKRAIEVRKRHQRLRLNSLLFQALEIQTKLGSAVPPSGLSSIDWFRRWCSSQRGWESGLGWTILGLGPGLSNPWIQFLPARSDPKPDYLSRLMLSRTINVQPIWHCGHFGRFGLCQLSNLLGINGMESSTPAASTNSM